VIAAALVLTACQVVGALLLTAGPSCSERYHQLLVWDGEWYRTIVDDGYHSTIPPVRQRPDLANVAFFPGYPITARALRTLTGWSAGTSLLLTAHLAAWLFWTYVLALCRRWRLSAGSTAAVVGVMVLHPAAFFLVVGYSESLFLAMLLGFVFWSARSSRAATVLAAVHGFAMTATRILGAGCAVYPVVHVDRSRATVQRALLLSAIAGLGAASFLAYCQWTFGAWDLYMQTARIGWDDSWDTGAIVNPVWYRISHRELVAALAGDVHQMTLLAVPIMLWELVAVALLAIVSRARDDSARRAGLGLLAVAALMFVVAVDGRGSLGMSGMLRYTFAMHACAVLAAVALAGAAAMGRPLRMVLSVAGVLVGLVSLRLQLGLIARFVAGKWVA
jgi:hypothetical protein